MKELPDVLGIRTIAENPIGLASKSLTGPATDDLHFLHHCPSHFVHGSNLPESSTAMCKSISLAIARLPLLALLAFVAPALAPVHAAEDLIVNYDQSELYALPRPAAQIIVGNPAIADISVRSDKLLVVTGKTFGITNIIILDSEGKTIKNQRVLVRRDEAKVVNLQRGVNRQSYNCSPQCNPSIIIGDESGYFESISKASQNKMGLSERASEPGAAGPPAANNN